MLSDALQRLAKRIRQLREEQLLSPPELSSRSGVSRASVHRLESAEMPPNLELLLKLASTFGCHVADLLITPGASTRDDLIERSRRAPKRAVEIAAALLSLPPSDLEEIAAIVEVKMRRR